MYIDDPTRFRHMLEAGEEALKFIKGKTKRHLRRDRKLALSLVKEIEIIGEAASKISAAGRRKRPRLPWRQIVAMRNRLIHAYHDVDYEIVWDTLTKDLPPLVRQLREIVSRS